MKNDALINEGTVYVSKRSGLAWAAPWQWDPVTYHMACHACVTRQTATWSVHNFNNNFRTVASGCGGVQNWLASHTDHI